MDPNTAELIRKGIEEREHTTNDPAIRGIVRVEVRVEDGLTYRAHTPLGAPVRPHHRRAP